MAISHAKAVERARKAARTRKKNANKSVAVRKTKSPARKPYKKRMSQGVTPAQLRGGAKVVLNGVFGGGAAAMIDSLLLSKMNPNLRIGVTALMGLGTATVLGFPSAGAGMAGYAAGKLAELIMSKAGLSENYDLRDNVAYAQEIAGLPAVLDKFGRPMAENYDLQENNNYDLQEGQMYLGEDGNFYQVPYAPSFSHPTTATAY